MRRLVLISIFLKIEIWLIKNNFFFCRFFFCSMVRISNFEGYACRIKFVCLVRNINFWKKFFPTKAILKFTSSCNVCPGGTLDYRRFHIGSILIIFTEMVLKQAKSKYLVIVYEWFMFVRSTIFSYSLSTTTCNYRKKRQKKKLFFIY